MKQIETQPIGEVYFFNVITIFSRLYVAGYQKLRRMDSGYATCFTILGEHAFSENILIHACRLFDNDLAT
mgnify:CR=1 FL=1